MGWNVDFVDLVFFHPHGRLVIALAVAHTLDIFVDVVSGAVGQHFDEFHGKVGIFRVARHVKRDVDGTADLYAFLERAGAVDEDVVARFHTALIEGAGLVDRAPMQQKPPPRVRTGFMGS